MWRMEGNVVLIVSPRKRLKWPWGVRAGLRHPVIKRLARAALPESELAALPPEENAELVKRLAEEIRKAADEYQRKMGVVH
jgi:histone H3/H4